jgi:peptidoglycan hydrolase CwlO-like protein
MIGALSAIVVTMGSLYSVVIIPQAQRIEKLEIGRESDGKQLALLYTSIQTNDEYKKTIVTELAWLRADIQRIGRQADALDEVHKQRAGQAAQIADLQARWERLDRHNEEVDRRNTPTILEDIKALRAELESLRQRIMVPVTAAHP